MFCCSDRHKGSRFLIHRRNPKTPEISFEQKVNKSCKFSHKILFDSDGVYIQQCSESKPRCKQFSPASHKLFSKSIENSTNRIRTNILKEKTRVISSKHSHNMSCFKFTNLKHPEKDQTDKSTERILYSKKKKIVQNAVYSQQYENFGQSAMKHYIGSSKEKKSRDYGKQFTYLRALEENKTEIVRKEVVGVRRKRTQGRRQGPPGQKFRLSLLRKLTKSLDCNSLNLTLVHLESLKFLQLKLPSSSPYLSLNSILASPPSLQPFCQSLNNYSTNLFSNIFLCFFEKERFHLFFWINRPVLHSEQHDLLKQIRQALERLVGKRRKEFLGEDQVVWVIGIGKKLSYFQYNCQCLELLTFS